MGSEALEIRKKKNSMQAPLIWGFVCLFYIQTTAQNLIYNGGAEIWNDSTSYIGANEFNTPYCDGWFINGPSWKFQFGTAFINSGSSFNNSFIRLNQFNANSGIGVFRLVGGLAFNPLSFSDQRTYLQTKLLDTLEQQCYYNFSFSVLPISKLGPLVNGPGGDGWSLTKELGFWFTESRPIDTTSIYGQEFSMYNPQPQVRLPQNYFITDTAQFTRLSSTFKAGNRFCYLTIGSFSHPDSILFLHLATGSVFTKATSPYKTGGMFFLDDLSLTLVPPPDSVFTTTGDTTICVGEPLTLFAYGEHAQWYLWSTGSTDSSITITQPGTYWVSCGFNCGFTKTDTIVVRPQVDVPPFVPSQDTVICPGDVVALFAPWPDALSYVWSDGSTDSTLQVNQPSVYWVEVAVPCGHTRRFEINVAHYPELPDGLVFPTDTIICAGTSYNYVLQPGPEYLLNNEHLAQPKLELSSPGVYTLTAQNRCFEVATTFLLETEICASKMWMPNTFTPNGDGLNDCVAPVLVNVLERDYHLVITDRWGNVVFESTTPGACWDGSFRGQIQAGVYTWRLTYRGRENGFQRAQGFVQVLL